MRLPETPPTPIERNTYCSCSRSLKTSRGYAALCSGCRGEPRKRRLYVVRLGGVSLGVPQPAAHQPRRRYLTVNQPLRTAAQNSVQHLEVAIQYVYMSIRCAVRMCSPAPGHGPACMLTDPWVVLRNPSRGSKRMAGPIAEMEKRAVSKVSVGFPECVGNEEKFCRFQSLGSTTTFDISYTRWSVALKRARFNGFQPTSMAGVTYIPLQCGLCK
ncbi:hypothetical protein HD806DRAFT_246928 [Xylariaceae sp. AK1471]|nr:hypothetical protein HD806DRAFT_246928 [Xylariaceae sp. AK1471]